MLTLRISATITLALLTLCSVVVAHAENTVEFTYRGSTLWTYVNDVDISGNYAFCAMQHGLMILDITDPAQPVFVSKHYVSFGSTHVVRVSGDYAYLGNYNRTLQIIDISDPAAPFLVGSFSTEEWVDDVEVVGTTVFLHDGFRGAVIVDASDPANPVETGIYTTHGGYGYVAAVGNILYYADYDSLRVLDVSDPSNPNLIGAYDSPYDIRGLEISGSHAFLLAYDEMMEIIDITTPSAPSLVGTWSGNIKEIAVDGNIVYVAQGHIDNDGGIEVLDISDPAAPYSAGHFNVSADDLDITGNHLLSANSVQDISVVDISDPAAPNITGVYALPYGYGHGQRAVVTDGNYAYVAFGPSGLIIVDVHDPANPFVVADSIISQPAFELALEGDYLYLGAYGGLVTDGLKIIDVSNPTDPSIIGSYTMSTVQEVTVHGDYVFLGGNSRYMDIVDVSNRADPTLAGRIERNGIMFGIAVQDNYAYVANWQDELLVVDISDIANPSIVNIIPLENDPYDVVIYKGYLLVAAQYGIYIMDIASFPVAPQEVASISFPYNACTELNMYGDLLFAATGYAEGAAIYDMTDPTAPQLIGSQKISGVVLSVAPFYENVFVIDQYGFMAFDCDLPACCATAGDVTLDGTVNVTDAVYLIEHIFKNGAGLHCRESADANADCTINVGDAVSLVNYIFNGGPAPVCSDCL